MSMFYDLPTKTDEKFSTYKIQTHGAVGVHSQMASMIELEKKPLYSEEGSCVLHPGSARGCLLTHRQDYSIELGIHILFATFLEIWERCLRPEVPEEIEIHSKRFHGIRSEVA